MTEIETKQFVLNSYESEKAANSYLMSLIAIIAGMPMPIVNLIATFAFYIANLKAPHFVKWHCTQNLLSQFSLFIINTTGFWWTMSIIFSDTTISNSYIAYVLSMIIFNAIELIATIISAMTIRKGNHIQWWFYGNLTNAICKPVGETSYH